MTLRNRSLSVVLAAGAAVAVCTSATLATDNIVGFNFTTAASTTPDPQNWTRISAIDGMLNNVTDDTGASTTISIEWGGNPPSAGPLFLSTSTLAPDAVPQHTYDLSGMSGYGFRAGGDLFIELSGLDPNTPYEYWFVAYRGGSNIDNDVSVSDGDTINATTFKQFVDSTTNNGRFLINTELSADTQEWNDLSFETTSSSTGTIRFNWQGDTQTTVIGALAIRKAVPPEPFDIRLLAQADQERIAIDDNVTITYEVRNPSPADVTGVEVSVDIPTGLSYVSDDRGGSVVGSAFTANLGDLDAGDNTFLNLVLRGDDADDYTIVGEVSANEPDPNPANNTASVDVMVSDATLRVLLTGAAATGGGTAEFMDVQSKLLDTGEFLVVDFFDASTTGVTPTLAQLQDYDAVMVWSNATYASDVDLGNVLADYVDAGGGVVTAVFETSTTTVGRSLLGRWDTDQYWIIQPRSGNTSSAASLGTIFDPTHPTAQNVNSLTATSAFRPSTTVLAPGGELIAAWDDGIPLIAVSDTRPNRVDLGMYPPSSSVSGTLWQVGTDGAIIMANALVYAAEGVPDCPPDLNGDGVVDADDFFLFLQFFADGDPRADFNNDGVIDADDFFAFLTAFAAGC